MNRRTMIRSALTGTAGLFGALGGAAWLFLRELKFGANPADGRLERVRRSPNFRDGGFQNQLPTEIMTKVHRSKSVWNLPWSRSRRARPAGPLPSLKCDLLHMPRDGNFMVWFGHSSYFIQIDGKRLIVDPVLSGTASPIPFTTRAFAGTDPYTVTDLPDVDYLFISHDHWDHLDYDTVKKLRSKVQSVVCGLGVGAHLERWGYGKERITEGDWGDSVDLGGGFTTYIRTARHFSGRDLHRNQTLWVSFALRTSSGYKIFLGGDGGYGPHFKQIGAEFDGFDLAVLENGQYNEAWRSIHMMPEQTLQAADDLRATHFIPVHNSKFCISNHDWDAPLRTITSIAGTRRSRILTPVIGQIVALQAPEAASAEWWKAPGVGEI